MFNDNQNKQPTKNILKQFKIKFTPAKKTAAIALFVLGLSVLSPNALGAKAASQQYTTPTAIVQTDQQSSHSQEQMKEGAKRVSETIEMLKNENETVSEKAQYNNHIISILERLSPNEMEKFSNGVFFNTYQFDDITLTVLNDDVEYYSNGYADLTEEFKSGRENFYDKIDEHFDSRKKDGSLKTEREYALDGIVGAVLEDYLVEYLIPMLASKPAANTLSHIVPAKSTLELTDKLETKEEVEYKIKRNLDVLTKANIDCNLQIIDLPDEVGVILNEKVLIAVKNNNGEMLDITKEKQASLQKELSPSL